jgi:hypothetical protein
MKQPNLSRVLLCGSPSRNRWNGISWFWRDTCCWDATPFLVENGPHRGSVAPNSYQTWYTLAPEITRKNVSGAKEIASGEGQDDSQTEY